MRGFVREKLYKPLLNHLVNGMSPARLTLTISLGIVFGMCPMLWLPTMLCISFALVLRLNFAVLQLSNYATYPLHLVCMIPFYKVGAYFFNEEFDLSVQQIIQMAENGVLEMIQKIGMSIVHALAAWAMMAPVMAICIYVILLPIIQRLAAKMKEKTILTVHHGNEQSIALTTLKKVA